MRRLFALLVLPFAGCTEGGPRLAPDAGAPYSEERAACADRDPLRKAYFGDLHVHTGLSFDAWTYDVRTTPADAYRFARGETIYLPPLDESGKPTFPVRLARPLDFAAVTDHAEYLGETHLCTTPGSSGYDSTTCHAYRPPDGSVTGFNPGDIDPTRAPMCGDGGAACLGAAAPLWQGMQDAAEAAYDRSASCSFTTFVAYEYSYSPVGSNLHRNVIFRNAHALPAPVTAYEAQRPIDLWHQLLHGCALAGTGCDVLAIPHNANLSNGNMFAVEYPGPLDDDSHRAVARLRADMEPVMEIFQHKGDSECSNGLPSAPGAPDELCEFEKMRRDDVTDCGKDGTGIGGLGAVGCVSWRDFARGILVTGMQEEKKLGVNPFKLGIIASTDTHNGTPGKVDEASFQGHLGMSDRTPKDLLGGSVIAARPVLTNPGGLAGVWAEENARDAIFDALRRREVFGTSGPRIAIRLFAGWDYPADLCAAPDLVAQGYAGGVPMGGDLRPPTSDAPRLVVSALRDAGTKESPGAQLERVQIIKLWVSADGAPHEEVHDVAGEAGKASVDPATCATSGSGADALCAVWTDPDFDPASPAAYYARALETPTCRWSTRVCAALPPDQRLALHCDDLGVPATIQERAWSSPIWYTP
jgi:hypothetical protein